MLKRKKVLFFGLGSIGQRHLNLLRKNFNYDIYAYRTTKTNAIPGITNIYDLNEALQINTDVAFITNPTYLHITTALLCLEAGIRNLFIEKPLTHSLNDLDYFFKKARESNALIYVGYSMRHNPVLKRLKKIVEDKIDQIFYAQTICSSYLPYWRQDKDYRDVYSAKKEKGGGVILELVHEFDYNEWLFGKIKSISGVYGKISKLEIDSEDFCDIYIKFEKNINGSLHLDYFSQSDNRSIRIISPLEEIKADLINNKIIYFKDKKILEENFSFKRDDYFEDQLKYFLKGVEAQDKSIDNLKDAKEIMEKIFLFKNSNEYIMV